MRATLMGEGPWGLCHVSFGYRMYSFVYIYFLWRIHSCKYLKPILYLMEPQWRVLGGSFSANEDFAPFLFL